MDKIRYFSPNFRRGQKSTTPKNREIQIHSLKISTGYVLHITGSRSSRIPVRSLFNTGRPRSYSSVRWPTQLRAIVDSNGSICTALRLGVVSAHSTLCTLHSTSNELHSTRPRLLHCATRQHKLAAFKLLPLPSGLLTLALVL